VRSNTQILFTLKSNPRVKRPRKPYKGKISIGSALIAPSAYLLRIAKSEANIIAINPSPLIGV
jgi:hypothetical protein